MLYKTVVKFVLAGVTAALVNFGSFVFFIKYAHFYYLWSSILAFSLAAIASFCLQKFWTFEKKSFNEIHLQFSLYLGVSILNLAFNTLLVFVFVSHFSFGHVLSQVFAGLIVAIENFFVLKHFVFKDITIINE